MIKLNNFSKSSYKQAKYNIMAAPFIHHVAPICLQIADFARPVFNYSPLALGTCCWRVCDKCDVGVSRPGPCCWSDHSHSVDKSSAGVGCRHTSRCRCSSCVDYSPDDATAGEAEVSSGWWTSGWVSVASSGVESDGNSARQHSTDHHAVITESST